MPNTPTLTEILPPHQRRKTRIGLVSGGLGAYWEQFPQLLPQLRESATYVTSRLRASDAEVIDAGFISDARQGAAAAETLRRADCDLIVMFAATYLTASMVLPIAQRAGAPVLVIDLQPSPAMDHANTTTGQWLAYAGSARYPKSPTYSVVLASNFARSPAICTRNLLGNGSIAGFRRQPSADACAPPDTG